MDVEKAEETPGGELEAGAARRKTRAQVRAEKEAEMFAGHASQVRKYS